MTILLMPGINNSGPEHWQTYWEKSNPEFRRVQVEDWDHPVCASWIDSIGRAVDACAGPAIIVAHSLGCLPVVEWAMRQGAAGVQGIMLVSVPEPSGPRFPAEAKGFAVPPLKPLPCSSIVVSSEDDPYGSPAWARRCADAWDSRFVSIGAAGHVNAASKLGMWEEGLALLRTLR